MAVKTKELRDRIVTVTAEGSQAEIDAWLDDYFVRFSPFGYDTKVQERDTLPDGRVRVVIKRSSSCD